MTTNTAKHAREPGKHHYVPEFILSPWAREWQPDQVKLRGYYWDKYTASIRHRDNGVGAFCYRIELLSFKGHARSRAALETRFFQAIDQKGSEAIDAMLVGGPNALSEDQRCDFARLLLSLEARRPPVVSRLRKEGAEYLRKGLDQDPEIVEAFAVRGVTASPSSYAAGHLGWSFEDRALLQIQKLVDNPKVGGRLINAGWSLKRLRREHGSLVLSDRPLIRTHGLDHDAATWVLPLGPKVAFIAANHTENLRRLRKVSPLTFIDQTNISSIGQAERYVFTVDAGHERTLAKYLRPKH
jgi:hypothetical protein